VPGRPFARNAAHRRFELSGMIASAGFTSGHRFVVGVWDTSPVGPLCDVMWAAPDGRRVLLVDRPQAAAFITAVYGFDEVRVVPLACERDADRLSVGAGPVHLELRLGRWWPIPAARLRRSPLIRPVERVLARLLLGVETVGVSPTGVGEWYRADRYRRVVTARAALDGVDLGGLTRFAVPARFGFSEPPRSPAVVRVAPLLEDRTGRLAATLDGGRSPGPP
jgi:hypothetical protein